MGALARNIVRMDARMREGEFGSLTGMELRGKMLVIVGFGSIGRHVAKIAHFGLGMKVLPVDVLSSQEIATSLGKSPDEIKAEYGLEAYTNDVNGVFRQADVISVHLPDIPQTRHFFNAERLAVMKPESMLINTARGPVVDERALYDVLSSGQLAGAALDVFEQEPYVPVDADKDLRKLENIVITPHIASNTRETNSRMATVCLKNIQTFFAGRMNHLSRVDID
jgi:phosphoglycerate dehydrogenase-like enzyme